tara:strand:+ start:4911 stop:5936 length:1026 start_codon:yes stop_codon:yes gene_type:complete
MRIKDNFSKNSYRLVIAIGDPAGIGTEITLKALGSSNIPKNMHPLLVGCKRTIELCYKNLKSKSNISLANPKDLEIVDLPLLNEIHPGIASRETGHASYMWLTRAIEIIMEGKGSALVTGPIAKHAWHQAGHLYAGQTEKLGAMTKVNNPSMLFTAISPNNGWRFNTLLATTHIPLKEVPLVLSPEIIISKLDTLYKFCKKFNRKPKILIAGLNPHSGEEGKLGSEEIDWLIPTINNWQAENSDVILEGPIPPDTCWIPAAEKWKGVSDRNTPDGILALYHDQGLIPVKLIAFDSAVNTTLGLPFIRTSPDHGTAFDIAGKGIAKHESMLAAINTAWEFSK